MLRLRSCMFLSTSLAIAGCSIHPLPKDVTRDTTFSIIRKIRCEARDALVSQILEQFSKSESARTRALVERIESGELSFLNQKFIHDKLARYSRISHLSQSDIAGVKQSVSPADLFYYWRSLKPLEEWQGNVDSATLKRINRFQWSSISFLFTFTITESKNKTANASMRMPIVKGLFTLGLKAGSEKSRANERLLEVADSFGTMVKELDCEFVHRPKKHWIYPITGNIGLGEVLDTWIDLVNSEPGGVNSFSDELTYKTKFLGQIKPQVSLADPPLKKFRLISADIDANADRLDQHKLKIALTYKSKNPADIVYDTIDLGQGVQIKIKKLKSSMPNFLPQGQGQGPTSAKGIYPTSPTQDEAIRQEGIRELRRLDSLTRQRDLNELIGR